ncbi:chemotaxis protein CheB [Corallococcus sp. AS-1-6]|uniref:chemotaxis protein CheB n=1 Tax=Corallococcus sp. AS-1-6 TaxID=2874599 RepID=UPI001CBD7382
MEALTALAKQLPRDLAACVLLVLHVPAQHRGYLPDILSRSGPLPAHHPRDGEEPLEPGRIYVAPNDRHLLVEPGRVRVLKGPRENGHRPAVDPLLRSAASTHGPRVVGVVLTGALDCGTSGLMAVKREGGLAVVQDPRDALCPDMPRSALEYVAVDHCVPLEAMGTLLTRLVDTPVAPRSRKRSRQLETEVKVMKVDIPSMDDPPSPMEYAKPSYYGCPDCGGVLFELEEGTLLRFRCRTGHAYTAEALAGSQQNPLDGALWAALRFEERARTAEAQVELLRQAVLAAPPPDAPSAGSEGSSGSGDSGGPDGSEQTG